MTQDSSGWFIGCPVRVLHQGGNPAHLAAEQREYIGGRAWVE
jgi:hypothetical protein